MKKNQGITLIALIITIIILLILVGVSINLAIKGDLFGSAQKAVSGTNAKVNEQQTRVDELMDELGRVEEQQRKENLPGTRVKENTKYVSGEKTAWIPAGFTVSKAEGETTIDGGLVIYLIDDKSDEEVENLTWTGTELENLKKTYDQFVWVPVTDANKMFMCQAKTADSECNLEIEGNSEDSTKSKKMAGRLYATSTEDNFNSNLTSQTYNANSGLREPAIVTGNSDGTGTDYDGNSGHNNIGLTLETLQEEYNSAVKKVIESKGFWIGRYETSGMNDSNDEIAVNIVAGKGTSDGITGMNGDGWYRMYKQQQNYVSQKNLDTTKIQSTMVFGAAYDQTMIFANCATKTAPQIKSEAEVATGAVETDCYKNIYDLCGIVIETTTEAYDTNSRIFRGR